MFDKIKDKIKHNLYCGVTLHNTRLIDDNYLNLGYQIVECAECGKKSIIFRSQGNMYMEEFNDKMYFRLKQFALQVDDFEKWEIEMNNNYLKIVSNIQDIISYPIGMDEIMIFSTQDIEYGTEKIIDMPFYDAINFIRPN